MIHLSLPEFGRIARSGIDPRLLQRLQRFDESHASAVGEPVFDWSNSHFVRAVNYVGVVRVPGLTVEILPKIDGGGQNENYVDGDYRELRARRNLLYMLSLTRDLPLQERDLASLRIERMPILEALIEIFASRLLVEMRRGLQHQYVYREENLGCVKGRLLVREHLSTNIGRHDRIFVGYDDFVSDTWLNRIIKAACYRLLSIARHGRTLQFLREAILELADVDDVPIESHHFGQVHLDRGTERFRTLLGFCRLVLTESSPAPSVGDMSTFSLLFPMEQLFEEFIGRFIKRYAADLGLERSSIHLQAASRSRWLLRNEDDQGRFQMRPDILIDGVGGQPHVIVDTKWKRLLSDDEDAKNGVLQADMYQLYAYATRFNCPSNVLLYPRIAGTTSKRYSIDGDTHRRQLRVEFVDLNIDLPKEIGRLKADLRQVISPIRIA